MEDENDWKCKRKIKKLGDYNLQCGDNELNHRMLDQEDDTIKLCKLFF